MKKVFLLCMMALALMASCHRPHVKHNHGVQMPRARVAKDSAQHNDIPKGTDNSWAEEDLIVIPDMPEDAEPQAHPESVDEMERMLSGAE